MCNFLSQIFYRLFCFTALQKSAINGKIMSIMNNDRVCGFFGIRNMEQIIKNVIEAEEKAAEIKAEAQKKAAEILENAEKSAAEIARRNEEECKLMREERIKLARAEAEEKYLKAIKEGADGAKKYADGLTKNTDKFADEIVRRVSGGGC